MKKPISIARIGNAFIINEGRGSFSTEDDCWEDILGVLIRNIKLNKAVGICTNVDDWIKGFSDRNSQLWVDFYNEHNIRVINTFKRVVKERFNLDTDQRCWIDGEKIYLMEFSEKRLWKNPKRKEIWSYLKRL